MANNVSMTRKNRLRRAVIVCRSFALNLVYYRVGWRKEYQHLLDPKRTTGNFWCVVNGNFIDICVLEWCKLFADKRAKHYWGKIVSDTADFKACLLRHLKMDEVAFIRQIDIIRTYRDKFVAHLDSDYSTMIPTLDVAKKAIWFYHSYIVRNEAKPGDLAGLPTDLDAGYKQCEREPRPFIVAYRRRIRAPSSRGRGYGSDKPGSRTPGLLGLRRASSVPYPRRPLAVRRGVR